MSTIPTNRASLKGIVSTIPTNRPSPKLIVPTIPINRLLPEIIVLAISIHRLPPKLIVPTIPIYRQSPDQLALQFQFVQSPKSVFTEVAKTSNVLTCNTKLELRCPSLFCSSLGQYTYQLTFAPTVESRSCLFIGIVRASHVKDCLAIYIIWTIDLG